MHNTFGSLWTLNNVTLWSRGSHLCEDFEDFEAQV